MKKYLIFLFFFGLKSPAFSQHQENITLDSAINYYEKLLQKDKHSPFGTYAMASVFFEKKSYKSAVEYSDLNLKTTNEYNAQAYLIKGISLERLNRISDAIANYEKALKIYPNDYLLWHNSAFANYKLQNLDRAQTATIKTMFLSPLFVQSYKLHACILLENKNNKNLVYYLLHALLLTETKQESDPIIIFLNNYIEKKYTNIEIPFFEKRYEISNVEELLNFYISPEKNQKINESARELPNALLQLDFNLESNSPLKKFFTNLKSEKLEEAYINYCLRYTDIEFVTGWIKTNKEELNRLATFLENNLEK